MEIRICFSKRFIWNVRRLGRWAYRIILGMMELFGLALVIVGGVVIWGEAGNYECGAAVHESAVVAAFLSVAIGGSFYGQYMRLTRSQRSVARLGKKRDAGSKREQKGPECCEHPGQDAKVK